MINTFLFYATSIVRHLCHRLPMPSNIWKKKYNTNVVMMICLKHAVKFHRPTLSQLYMYESCVSPMMNLNRLPSTISTRRCALNSPQSSVTLRAKPKSNYNLAVFHRKLFLIFLIQFKYKDPLSNNCQCNATMETTV